MQEIPVIALSDVQQRLSHCSACDSEEKPIKQFAIKVSRESRQTVAYCEECSHEIATFLTRTWEG